MRQEANPLMYYSLQYSAQIQLGKAFVITCNGSWRRKAIYELDMTI
jgi:hypothetical protein